MIKKTKKLKNCNKRNRKSPMKKEQEKLTINKRRLKTGKTKLKKI